MSSVNKIYIDSSKIKRASNEAHSMCTHIKNLQIKLVQINVYTLKFIKFILDIAILDMQFLILQF